MVYRNFPDEIIGILDQGKINMLNDANIVYVDEYDTYENAQRMRNTHQKMDVYVVRDFALFVFVTGVVVYLSRLP